MASFGKSGFTPYTSVGPQTSVTSVRIGFFRVLGPRRDRGAWIPAVIPVVIGPRFPNRDSAKPPRCGPGVDGVGLCLLRSVIEGVRCRPDHHHRAT